MPAIESNHIFINGIDINEYSLYSLRKNIFYLSQESILLEGTLRESFKLFNKDITEKEMLIAFKKACIYDDIMSSLLNGLDTTLTKNASPFSGGQKQRLCLAFLFAQNANVIIADEPFNGIDKEPTSIIWRNMQDYCKDKIVIFIDHIFEDNTYFNKHLTLYDGNLVECDLTRASRLMRFLSFIFIK